ncbi:MAG: multiprotein bridging factor aMBF1 [Promethearchaeota archaeon]
MGTCDICGATSPVELVKIDGANMYACPRCSKFGEKVEFSPTRATGRKIPPKPATVMRTPRTPVHRTSRMRTEKTIIENYGKKIQNARKALGLTRKELGEQIFEKETLLARIETERIIPDDKVVEKLEQKLKIQLLEEMEEPISGDSIQEPVFTGKSATLGSIARIKRRKKE